MYNVQIKAAVALLVATLVACGPSEQEKAAKMRQEKANELVAQIGTAYDDGRYVEALQLIDSVQKTYADFPDVVDRAGKYFTRAMEGMLLDSIPFADARMYAVQASMDSLGQFFVTRNEYKIDRALAGRDFAGQTCAEPRLGDETSPWQLNVNIVGTPIGINGLKLLIDGSEVAVVLPDFAAERVAKGNGCEMFSFGPEESEPIAEALRANSQGAAVLKVIGDKGERDIMLSAPVRRAIIRTSDMVRLKFEDNEARKNRELLERKLILARDRIANQN